MNLNERLRARKRPSAEYTIVLDEDQYQSALGIEDADERKAALDECSITLTIRALAPQRWDSLVEEHPNVEDEDGNERWGDHFISALLAECVDGDITAEDWDDYISSGVMTAGEMGAIGSKAIELNLRSVTDPKF